ncbi:hypothetical protein Metli_1827 [Methanofollis liminatans DSM 4140]|uniref:TFIIB-type zinc ribbon-containing protein n=1 Tax=Methanofollis liminatans DSM 4140 TaxID=28892 RepID=J0S1K6_9EURY|nr:hypothetical protein [Methanofollis liminatans]EJG07771.1 hypothetical protein Metli_1827 [Methanofollis liminatans DSM 4140]
MLRCPQCGSTDLYEELGGYGGFRYRCKQCGYTGSFVIESEEELPSPEAVVHEEGETHFTIPLWIKIVAVLFVLYLLLTLATL